jgi:methanogenic corrinoid protein MtbC1
MAAEVQRSFADALLRGRASEAEAVVREAIDAGLGEALIDDAVIRPALRLVGDLWAEGEISIAREHLATGIAMRVLALQRDLFRLSRQRTSHRVLLAGAEGERHVVGLEMAASIIGHAGYDVRVLGADLPVDEIGPAVAEHRPAVVGFTTATERTATNLPPAFDAVRRRGRGAGIVVGGLGADDAWTSAWDVVVCRHVADAVDNVDALVRRAAHN